MCALHEVLGDAAHELQALERDLVVKDAAGGGGGARRGAGGGAGWLACCCGHGPPMGGWGSVGQKHILLSS